MKFRYSFFTWAILVWMTFSSFVHQFHFSETLIEWIPRDGKMQMTIKVFTDDWDLAMLQASSADFDENAQRYLNEHVKISGSNDTIHWHYVGHERDGDLYYHYLETDRISFPEELTVQMNILMELYGDQKNLLNFRKDGQTKSLYFLDKNSIQHFNWAP